jgi:hypothetical protein
MNRSTTFAVALIAALTLARPTADVPSIRVTGRIIDGQTRRPIADAILTAGDLVVRSDASGAFAIDIPRVDVLRARAAGYERSDLPVRQEARTEVEIPLKAIRPKAVYLSVYGIGDKRLRDAALSLVDHAELNALVIDMKGDRGIVPYRSQVPLASEVGAQKVITIGNLPSLISDLHNRGIYLIARIVVFKDLPLAMGRPDMAIHRTGGAIYRDREDLAWTNPFNEEVWSYNIAIAVEAARAGFDEIQFDYARFPDATGLLFDRPWTQANREAAIEGFYRAAGKALAPYNVFVAADIFGYVCWNQNDTNIGQNIEHLGELVDYLSPMLYPSTFQFGIPGCRNPVQDPYQIVRQSLERAQQRTRLARLRFRPWLQAFSDYAFDRRSFKTGEVRSQITAAEQFGSDGWMLWNPRNEYDAQDLKRQSE